MKIPINIPDIGKEEIREVTAVLSEKSLTSSSFEGGKRVQQFEKLLSKFVKSKFAVAVNSGTAALQASLYAIDIKPGDEILVPSFTFVATANSVKSVGAKTVFVDILKELPITLLLRPFNFETLATYVYQYASDEMLEESSFAALIIIVAGLGPVIFLSKTIKKYSVSYDFFGEQVAEFLQIQIVSMSFNYFLTHRFQMHILLEVALYQLI